MWNGSEKHTLYTEILEKAAKMNKSFDILGSSRSHQPFTYLQPLEQWIKEERIRHMCVWRGGYDRGL